MYKDEFLGLMMERVASFSVNVNCYNYPSEKPGKAQITFVLTDDEDPVFFAKKFSDFLVECMPNRETDT